jgi:hypothetical protein
MIIIRAVFSLAVLALAGVLVVVLSGHLWSRYQEETVALERLASQVGFSGSLNVYGTFVEGEGTPLPVVREAVALEE